VRSTSAASRGLTPRLYKVSGVRANLSCGRPDLAKLREVFEKLFKVATSLRRPAGLRARLHSPRFEALNSASRIPTEWVSPSKGRRPPGSGWAARFFCRPHHFSGARVNAQRAPGPDSWRDRLEGPAGPIVFPPRRSDRRSRLFVNPQRAGCPLGVDAGA